MLVFHNNKYETAVITLVALLNTRRFIMRKLRIPAWLCSAVYVRYGIVQVLYAISAYNIQVVPQGVILGTRA